MTTDQGGTIMSMADRMTRSHRCRPGAQAPAWSDRPPYAAPGQLVKVTGENRWGRVASLMTCCGEYIVEFAEDQALTAERMRAGDLESPYARPDDSLPPLGYLIPHRYTRTITPFGGRRT
jgi:hypothetical protein